MAEKLAVEVVLEGSEKLQQDLALMKKGFEDIGVSLVRLTTQFAAFSAIAGTVAIAAAATQLIRFTKAAEETSQALTELQKVSGASFQNLSALQQVFAAGGTAVNKFATEFGNLSDKIKDAGVAKGIRDWKQFGFGNEWVKWANDIDHVANNFDILARGIGTIPFDALTTMQTKTEALLESLAKVKDPQEQWAKLADIFKTLSSQGTQGVAEVQRLGKALGLSPETIATLSQGSAAIKAMQAEAERLGLTLTTSNQQALQQMAQGWNQFTTLLSAAFQKIAAAAAPTFAQLVAIATPALQQIVADFQNLPLDQAMANLGARLAPAFQAAMKVLQPIFAQIGEELIATAETIGLAIGKAIVLGMIPGILQGKGPIVEALKQLFQLGTPELGGAGGSQPGGAASGGLIGGRGTGTSDSNLAWVSRGEHIMPARAVAQPGMLAFLEALRRSGGNLSRVLDGMGRFALGGMVARPIPAFAGGGLVGGMSNVTIHFPGVPPVTGLRASSAVVDELRNAAALAQVRSGGRKPSRYS